MRSLEELDEIICKVPQGNRFWCNGGICGCMGCFQSKQTGVSKEEFKYWEFNNPDKLPHRESDESIQYRFNLAMKTIYESNGG